jgi:hypothetical protein
MLAPRSASLPPSLGKDVVVERAFGLIELFDTAHYFDKSILCQFLCVLVGKTETAEVPVESLPIRFYECFWVHFRQFIRATYAEARVLYDTQYVREISRRGDEVTEISKKY